MIPKRRDSPLLTVEQIRVLETDLFTQKDSYAVMQTAAQAIYEAVLADFPVPIAEQTVHIVLGAGNNAGDGLVVGALLQNAGFSVTAYRVFDADFHGDAAKGLQYAKDAGVMICPFYPFLCKPQDVMIEALFGIGLSRPITGVALTAVKHINRQKQQFPDLCVYAVDVPAGILCDTGAISGETAVYADKTVTFIGDKVGLHTAEGKGCAGKVVLANLGAEGLPTATIQRYAYETHVLNPHSNTHKGNYGHALIIGGGVGMFGAGALAAVSALKVGVGKASLYTHPDYQQQYHLQGTPLYEVMRCQAINDLALFSSVILGTGLGRDAWGRQQFEETLTALGKQQVLLIDADGLWHLAEVGQADAVINHQVTVITPHEAEAARLLHCSIADVCADKLSAVRELAQHYHCIAVLKGAGTLISDGENVWVNTSGNCCLATAGTGDVLAGMIGGYLAQSVVQGHSLLDTVLYGVFRHGKGADDYWSQHYDKTMRASDLWRYL